ncbi:thioredoxin [Patescibacteria group bacterium AH-259-L05]|nr:thioredoxin [Patescibacteria group bacterium AH-259-L05]
MTMTLQQLKQQIADSSLTMVIEFWASWCAPCQMMKPVIEELEKEYKNKIKVIKINSDLSPKIVSQYTVQGLPTIIIFKNGKEAERVTGAQSKQALSKLIEKYS